jgi:3-oxoacyl-[acyl-carrier-protein] synthase II
VPVLIASSVAVTCLGDEEATFRALLAGTSGVGALRHFPADRLNVRYGYHLPEPDGREGSGRVARWLAGCVAEAVRRAGVDPRRQRVAAVVGTGLGGLRDVERWAVDGVPVRPEGLHFAAAVHSALGGYAGTVTLSNACGAGGYALALGADMLDLGEADAVVVAAADGMTESMLAMIGRFGEEPTVQVRPFDRQRTGVLLGEGAAAVVLVPQRPGTRAVARLLGTGLSCDAWHETAPDPAGIRRAMDDALARAGRAPGQVDLVYAHGTGTALNDPTEASVLGEVFAAARPGPLVTAVKGAVGHTSGAAALTSLAMAVQSLRRQLAPPVVGLREPLPEAAGLRLVTGRACPTRVRTVQVNAFGFGGVNAVTLLEPA